MANNRKAFIQVAISRLKEIDPQNESIPALEKILTEMPEKDFKLYIERLRNGVSEDPDLDKPRELLPLVLPNMKKTAITVARNIAIGKKWGHQFFERCFLTDPLTGQTVLTNLPYAVFELPVVRQAQTLEKGIAYEKDGTRLDDRTNQVSDGTKGSSFSAPEVQALLSQGQDRSVVELMKFRGGDNIAYRTMYDSLLKTGKFRMDSYKEPTRPKSADVANIYLKASHIDNDL